MISQLTRNALKGQQQLAQGSALGGVKSVSRSRCKCKSPSPFYAFAFKRLKAAAQHSSNKFGSAFALHFNCPCRALVCCITLTLKRKVSLTQLLKEKP